MDQGLREGKYKTEWEHIVVPESKEVLKKGRNHVSRTQKLT